METFKIILSSLFSVSVLVYLFLDYKQMKNRIKLYKSFDDRITALENLLNKKEQ